MKIKHLFLSVLAMASVAVACNKNVDPNDGKPSLTLNPTELTFEIDGGTKTVAVEANREWSVVDGDKTAWVKAEKASDTEITVTVEPNTGFDRSLEFTVRMVGVKKTFKVSQKGTGAQEDAYVYHNNFDKEDAVKDGNYWPYLDKSECWKNEEGSGVSTVTYASSTATVRQSGKLSNAEGYTDYAGSGRNKIFFGANANLQIQNITLPASTNFELTFGGNRYIQSDASNVFNHDEFKVYVSNDGKKYVELAYAFANGDPDGKWSLASSKFTVPSGTSALYIYFTATKASAYSIDDVSLLTSATAGTEIDFSKGTEIGGGSTPVEPTPGEKPTLTKVTVAEFLTKDVNTTDWYELTGTVSNIASTVYGNFTLTDETGSVYIYGLQKDYAAGNAKNFESLDIKAGDNITIGTLRAEFKGTAQGGGKEYAAFLVSKNGSSPVDPEPTDPTDPTEDPTTITWKADVNAKSYDATAKVGDETYKGFKLGSGKGVGTIDVTIPSGTSKVTFYAGAWAGKKSTLSFSMDGTEVSKFAVASVTGFTGDSNDFTLTGVTDEYKYTIDIAALNGGKVPETAITVKAASVNTGDNRVLVWNIVAE